MHIQFTRGLRSMTTNIQMAEQILTRRQTVFDQIFTS